MSANPAHADPAAPAEPDAWQAARRRGVSLFGAGGFARDVARALQAQGVTVHAFLTSGPPSCDEVDGLPVRQADAAALGMAPVWVAVYNREAHSDYAAVDAWLRGLHPGVDLCWPQTYYGLLRAHLGFRFWLHPPREFAAAASDIARARALLDDAASRQAYDQVLAFRQDLAAHARPPQPHPGTQYMPHWLVQHLAQTSFGPLRIVDGGAYRGETLHALATLVPIDQAWTFEPDPHNHAALVRALARWPAPAVHLPVGLSDRTGTARFSQGQGEANHLCADGAQQVPLAALDDCLHLAPVNFLKLDVEGHELAALAGARATLLRQRPLLAIAGYHRWDDLWRIPAFIDDLGLGYRFRLGLHGHNSFDAVIYAFQG